MMALTTPRLWSVVFVLAMLSLAVSTYVGYRYVGLADCLSARDLADQRRTAAIALATDHERRADLALIRGDGEPAKLRADALAAREHTDRVRQEHPAPPVKPCK